MTTQTRAKRLSTQALGLVFLIVLALLVWLSLAIYSKAFSDAVPVTLRTERVGNQLTVNADVKVRGVVVGQVRDISPTDSGAALELRIEPDRLESLPSNVSARLVPKSVFGQRYVNLIIPAEPAADHLAAGDVIEQDDSAVAIELEKVLNDLMPLLQAVQPQKLAASLGAAKQALDGRGEELGGTLVRLNKYLNQLNPHLPQLQEDIAKLAEVLDSYGVAGPDVVDALADTATTAKTLAERKEDVRELLVTMAAAAEELDGFVRPNKDVLVQLLANSRPILELLAEHSGQFPCLFSAVNELKPHVDKALGAGTNEPGLHVQLDVKRPGGSGGSAELKC